MFCVNCGSKPVEGDRFCTTCGQARRSISASESVAAPVLEEPETPAEEPISAEAVESAPPVDQTVPVAQPGEKPLYCTHSPSERTKLGLDMHHGSDICLGCRLPYSPGSPNSGFHPVAEAPTRAGVRDDVDPLGDRLDANLTPQGGAGRHARWRLGLIAALTALVVLGVIGVALNTTASGAPPADPAQALHRLRDVAKIDLPIDDAGVDAGRYMVPLDMPQQPSAVGEDLGSVSMGSGNTIELRVSAYTLASDAAQYALWWNTSGVKEYFAASSVTDSSVAVQCGRIVIDGAWVARHTQDDTIKLLHQAYPDCTPYIPEKAAPAPEPSTEPAPPVEETPTPEPAPTRTPPPAVEGYHTYGNPVSGAFAITNLVVTDKGQGNLSVSFTVKNTTRQVLTLRPIVEVSLQATDTTPWQNAEFDGKDLCHSLRPNESERITIAEGSGYGAVPTTWTEAVVKNFDIC